MPPPCPRFIQSNFGPIKKVLFLQKTKKVVFLGAEFFLKRPHWQKWVQNMVKIEKNCKNRGRDQSCSKHPKLHSGPLVRPPWGSFWPDLGPGGVPPPLDLPLQTPPTGTSRADFSRSGGSTPGVYFGRFSPHFATGGPQRPAEAPNFFPNQLRSTRE